MSYLSSLQGVKVATSGMCPDLWDAKLELHSDSELDEWLQFFDNNQSKVNDLSSKLDKQETAEQVLQNIEDLGIFENEYWVTESPLFEEIQSLVPFYHVDTESCINTEYAQPENSKTAKQYDIDTAEAVNLEKSSNTNIDSHLSEVTSVLLSNETSEMAVVDEILKNTVIEIKNWESDTSRSEISSDGGSSSEVAPSPIQEEESDDAEWKPGPLKRPRERKSYYKKSKTYLRGGSQEDKRLRKKEQNKNAATRYRQKKKAEISEILKEERELMAKKAKLEEKVFDIQNEIRYLKGLMRDLFKAKGLIN